VSELVDRLFGLKGAVALITGSSAGIGLALARGLADAGARVVVNGRTRATVEAAAASLRAAGAEVFVAPFDVTKSGEVGEAIGRIEADFGPIDILVNNAGVQRRGPLEGYPEESWRELMRANLNSVFYVGQSIARRMIACRRGSIVNIASVQSELARIGVAPYTASKGGVKMLTKGMATDWGQYGLRVNAIAPGYFKTELNKALVEDEKFSAWLAARTPVRRWGDLDQRVGAAIFLASDASSFVNGRNLYVDGGVTACL
jgi:gluconate 5-dehydrogenase